MRIRKLRIAWSVACVIACVLLIALWVRSYSWVDELEGSIVGRGVAALSAQGKFRLDLYSPPYRLPGMWHSEPIQQRMTVGLNTSEGGTVFRTKLIHFSITTKRVFLWSYHLLPTFVMAILAGTPWLPWRFSLRTLLIATTLVAVVLGFAVFVANR
jgi:hypothetical protein